MYGFPLTIYLLSGWLGSRIPQLDILSHNAGHLWHTLFGLKDDPHFDVFHLISFVPIFVARHTRGGRLHRQLGFVGRIGHPRNQKCRRSTGGRPSRGAWRRTIHALHVDY